MKNLIRALYHFNTRNWLKTPYVQACLMSTKPSKPLPPSLTVENSKKHLIQTPQYEIDANLYRQRFYKNPTDTNAIYRLAICIGQGATIFPVDIRGTRLEDIGIQKVSSRDLQAELYRKLLKWNCFHKEAILGLANCIKNGTAPQFEDLRNTWLEGGNWMIEDRWGLTKPVISLLVRALEERSKAPVDDLYKYKNLQKNRPK